MRLWQVLHLALLLVPGMLLLWRVRRCGQGAGGEGRPARVRGQPRRFSVVIPARNEAARLPALLDSLAAQTLAPREIILVDDGSTDATAELARAAGCRVVPAGARPEGWLGKTWACWVGAGLASGELILFLDADTRVEPDGCRMLLAEREEWGGVVTVQPWHQTGSWAERLSSYFNIIVMAAINTFTVFGDLLPPAGCFGPCILCGRDEYFAVDGHRGVRGSILEDLDLGKGFLSAGVPVRCRGGRGAIRFRMYPGGIAEQVEGWSKNMARGAQGAAPVVLACLVLWITGTASAAFCAVRWCVTGPTFAALQALVFYFLYAGQFLWMLRRAGNFGPLTALVFPGHLFFFVWVFLRSLLLTFVVKRVTWKGRSIGSPSGGG